MYNNSTLISGKQSTGKPVVTEVLWNSEAFGRPVIRLDVRDIPRSIEALHATLRSYSREQRAVILIDMDLSTAALGRHHLELYDLIDLSSITVYVVAEQPTEEFSALFERHIRLS